MAVVAQVQQGPIVAVAAQDDVSAATTITAIRTSIGVVLHTAHVCATASTLARAAVYLYIIYEIGFSHDLVSYELYNKWS